MPSGVAPPTNTAKPKPSLSAMLYTMRSEEVAGWVRSLALRGVELPDGLKDEVVMIVSERRTATL